MTNLQEATHGMRTDRAARQRKESTMQTNQPRPAGHLRWAEDSVLEQPTRRRIYDTVSTHPGASLRDLSRILSMPLGTTYYHLQALVDAGKIRLVDDGRYTRFFHPQVPTQEREAIMALRRPTLARIARALLPERKPITPTELSAEVGASRSTMSESLAQLERRGLLHSERRGGYKFVHLRNRELVLRIFDANRDIVEKAVLA